jgi:hypothetical protein
MLEDANFTDIVSWGYTGDSFVVKVRWGLFAVVDSIASPRYSTHPPPANRT